MDASPGIHRSVGRVAGCGISSSDLDGKASGWTVVIMTYNRPLLLLELLRDLEREQQRGVRLDVHVYEDHSSADYSEPREVLRKNGWRHCHADRHYGKQGFWRWTTRSYQDLRRYGAWPMLLFIPDDCRLCERFFERAGAEWLAVEDPRKLTLTVLVDASREHTSCWTGVTPARAGRPWRTQWVDGAFVAVRQYLEVMNYRVPEVPANRWEADPNLSSGVGRAISLRLHRLGWGMYRTHESLILHRGEHSLMNGALRQQEPLETVRYVDAFLQERRKRLHLSGASSSTCGETEAGEQDISPIGATATSAPKNAASGAATTRIVALASHEDPENLAHEDPEGAPEVFGGHWIVAAAGTEPERVSGEPCVARRDGLAAQEDREGMPEAAQIPRIAALATIPGRESALARTVSSLLPQLDRICVYLNGHERLPECLEEERIDIVWSRQHGDRGDAGKFWWCQMQGVYLFTCDDDIIYPPDYVSHLVNRLERYGRSVVVGLHGVLIREPVISYYRNRTVLHCRHVLDEDRPVHLVGTGCAAWHTAAVEVSPDDFKLPDMADIWFGRLCQVQQVPVVAVARPENWLRVQEVGETIYKRFNRRDEIQSRLVSELTPWHLFHPIELTSR